MKTYNETLSMAQAMYDAARDNKAVVSIKFEQFEDLYSWLKLAKPHFKDKSATVTAKVGV